MVATPELEMGSSELIMLDRVFSEEIQSPKRPFSMLSRHGVESACRGNRNREAQLRERNASASDKKREFFGFGLTVEAICRGHEAAELKGPELGVSDHKLGVDSFEQAVQRRRTEPISAGGRFLWGTIGEQQLSNHRRRCSATEIGGQPK
jgi:hypothetical protein